MSEIVWEANLDEKYDCKVTRLGEYVGTLTISENNKVIFSEEVALAYGAKFGADVEDITTWQDIIIDFIDSKYYTPS